ncbi:MAG TPA: hypothetical protein VJQ55_07640, partial [Candidatus Binatia bacterium]|nr:hypothetical protein [Candidatus Binatia bacterium]
MRALSKPNLLLIATLLHAPVEAEDKQLAGHLITVWSGDLPIILTAPHGGRQAVPGVGARRGVGVPQFTVERDSNTAELAEMVADKTAERLAAKPFVVIARFERKYIDANRAEAAAFESPAAKVHYDAYHQAIEAAVQAVRQKWGGGLLIDIHGQGAEAETIFRGTDNGKSVSGLEQRFGRDAIMGPKSILGWLAAKGHKIE